MAREDPRDGERGRRRTDRRGEPRVGIARQIGEHLRSLRAEGPHQVDLGIGPRLGQQNVEREALRLGRRDDLDEFGQRRPAPRPATLFADRRGVDADDDDFAARLIRAGKALPEVDYPRIEPEERVEDALTARRTDNQRQRKRRAQNAPTRRDGPSATVGEHAEPPHPRRLRPVRRSGPCPLRRSPSASRPGRPRRSSAARSSARRR